MTTDAATIDTLRRMLAAANELLATRELQIAALRQALHDITAARDAWEQQCREVMVWRAEWEQRARIAEGGAVIAHDATDPGPQLVAETRAQFDCIGQEREALAQRFQMPANALRMRTGPGYETPGKDRWWR
jgi:hypothetical protein